MKVVFVASINGKKEQKFFYLSIIGILKTLGHEVFYKHVINENSDSINKSNQKNITFHKNIIKKIKNADFIVSEITHESISVGYLIHEALTNSKPVICLSRLDTVPNMSIFLENYKKFIFVPYKKIFELEKNLPKIILDLPIEKQKKLNFLIDEKLDEKLKKVADKKGVTKSDLLRNFVEKL